MTWEQFKQWVQVRGLTIDEQDICNAYIVDNGVRTHICYDGMEDGDSGEIEETIDAIGAYLLLKELQQNYPELNKYYITKQLGYHLNDKARNS